MWESCAILRRQRVPIVYRSGHQPFKLVRRVRFPLGTPLFVAALGGHFGGSPRVPTSAHLLLGVREYAFVLVRSAGDEFTALPAPWFVDGALWGERRAGRGGPGGLRRSGV